jgi:hypothetical protein
MPFSPLAPRLLKGGIVQVTAGTGAVERVIALQYNPETLTRTLQVQGAGEAGDRAEALRLTGPPIETYQLEAEIDAADQVELFKATRAEPGQGVYPALAALEMLAYPESSRLVENNARAERGVLEIAPLEAPLTLLVWSKNRVLPVRLTEFSVTEEFFDPELNPIRARVNLSLRVLSVSDLPFQHRGAGLYLTYHRRLERLARQYRGGALGDLGITESALAPESESAG